ncbi:hypothetical protein [Halomonas eurihalina]|uniref:hypothetical protein n=1 Tax=Halomonas eurihalina TaxID=42566 RepID=UPI001659F0DD|nr:hypothetical protein [Halomonas eurihalina]MDR5860619.1 hypothetical protein [Halomonas eurihalina]
MITLAPEAIIALTLASPMPDAAPVTAATLPVNAFAISLSPCLHGISSTGYRPGACQGTTHLMTEMLEAGLMSSVDVGLDSNVDLIWHLGDFAEC